MQFSSPGATNNAPTQCDKSGTLSQRILTNIHIKEFLKMLVLCGVDSPFLQLWWVCSRTLWWWQWCSSAPRSCAPPTSSSWPSLPLTSCSPWWSTQTHYLFHNFQITESAPCPSTKIEKKKSASKSRTNPNYSWWPAALWGRSWRSPRRCTSHLSDSHGLSDQKLEVGARWPLTKLLVAV